MVLESVLPLLGSLRDQVVLVTGASSGIGRQTALAFAARGAAVALAARRRAHLEALQAEIVAAGGRALVVPTDVSDQQSALACVSTVKRTWRRIDILVNNAGILRPAPVEQLTAADFEAMTSVNVFGTLFMMQAVLPGMRRRRAGTIINVASLGGRRGVSPLGGYCATKFAVVGLTEALRTELADSSVHVGLVMPGVIETPMVHGADVEALQAWPSFLNMPAQWVVAAIMLAARFRLREISVPPGAATVELLGAMAPAMSDTLIRWGAAASRAIARTSKGKNTPAATPTRSTKSR